jgi:hypothetical protein
MNYEPLNRRLATLAAVFAFLGVILGVIALATNYWTITNVVNDVHNETGIVNNQSTIQWNVCILKFQKMNSFY